MREVNRTAMIFIYFCKILFLFIRLFDVTFTSYFMLSEFTTA